MIMPAHQIGFWRYSVDFMGPSRWFLASFPPPALMRPFFVMMKLHPIAALPVRARKSPMYLENEMHNPKGEFSERKE